MKKAIIALFSLSLLVFVSPVHGTNMTNAADVLNVGGGHPIQPPV